jgi:hypothetical protein
LIREGDLIPWVVHVDGERRLWNGIVVGINIHFEVGDWDVKREL